MPISAASIVRRVTDLIMDNTSVRWPVNELVRYLNDGQREIMIVRPDAINKTATVNLVAGTRQNLDSMGLSPAPIKLIEITRNMAASSLKKAVRPVERRLLDAQTPEWHNLPGTVNILHSMFDPRDPKTFYVFPPALPSAQLEVNYSGMPPDVAEPAPGALFGDVVGNLGVPDIYGNVILDYILYRAYSKDSEFAGNAARAASHYAAFSASLGMEIKATLAVQPQILPDKSAPA